MLTFKQFLYNGSNIGRINESDIQSRTKLEKLAKRLGLSGTELQKMGDDEVNIILKDLGKHDFVPDSKFDAEQLKLGIKIEKEHTNSTLVAKLIAKDHLSEDKWYYKKLTKMENGDE